MLWLVGWSVGRVLPRPPLLRPPSRPLRRGDVSDVRASSPPPIRRSSARRTASVGATGARRQRRPESVGDEADPSCWSAPLADAGVATASPVPVAGRRRPSTYRCSTRLAAAAEPRRALPHAVRHRPDAVASLRQLDRRAGTVDAAARARSASGCCSTGGGMSPRPGWRCDWDPAAPSAADADRRLDRGDASRAWPAPPTPASRPTSRGPRRRLAGVGVVIDGACLTTRPYTGTQHLVLEVARWLSVTRPDGTVIAGRRRAQSIAGAPSVCSAVSGVDVVERATRRRRRRALPARTRCCSPASSTSSRDTGRRTLVGQLDMIGFSNPFYHPSDQLFVLRPQPAAPPDADGRRRHVHLRVRARQRRRRVPRPRTAPAARRVVRRRPTPGVAGHRRRRRPTGSTRVPRVPVIDVLAQEPGPRDRHLRVAASSEHGYDGHLVIVGPEPFYGRSTDAERRADRPSARRRSAIGSTAGATCPTPRSGGCCARRRRRCTRRSSRGSGSSRSKRRPSGTPCLAYAGTAPGELLARHRVRSIDSWAPSVWAAGSPTCDRRPDSQPRASVGEVAAAPAAHVASGAPSARGTAIDAALALPRRSVTSTTEGGHLARCGSRSPAARVGRIDGSTAARAQPALARRLRRAGRERRRRRPSDDG